MLKHFNKENLKIFFKAIKNEPISLIMRNGLNKLNGKGKKIIGVSEEAQNFNLAEGVKFKITFVKFTSPKECEIKGWFVTDETFKSIQFIDESSDELQELKTKKLGNDLKLSLNLDSTEFSRQFFGKIKCLAQRRLLKFKLETVSKTRVLEFDISPYLNNGVLQTQVVNSFQHPHPTLYRERSNNTFHCEENDPKLICFYLPQFHRTEENDKWWGKGFTEWTNVSKALPKFEYHYQPRLPGELGFYDLQNPEILERQTDLAKQYGISGFCFHYYWFKGRKVLDMPINQFLKNKNIEFKYCINWANENWTRAWDGAEDNVLLKQDYDLKNVSAFYEDLKPFFSDSRYIKVDGKPVLSIYRPLHSTLIKEWITALRKLAKQDGFPGLHVIGCQSIENIEDPQSLNLDRTVHFPPHHMATRNKTLKYHGYSLSHIKTSLPEKMYNHSFDGEILNYSDVSISSYNYEAPDHEYETVFPAWDNCARKDNFGTPFIFSTPSKYGVWLNNCLKRLMNKPEPFVFVNAWNEWAEGAYLEPDRHFGYAYLQKTAEILAQHSASEKNRKMFPISEFEKKSEIAIIIHLYYTEFWPEIVSKLKDLKPRFDLYISLTKSSSFFKKVIVDAFPSANVMIVENRGRDVGPFFEVMSKINHLEYDYIAKLHSKKSPHAKNGSFWRNYSFESLIGSDKIIDQAITNFKTDSSLGVQTGMKNVFSFKRWGLGSNKDEMEKLSNLLGITDSYKELIKYCKEGQIEKLDDYEDNLVKFNKDENILDEEYLFPAGTMFWFRPEALNGLFDLGISSDNFAPEQGQLDGTLAHAIERMVGLISKTNNFDIGILK